MVRMRKLILRKETLAALTPDELRQVVGAEPTGSLTLPAKNCVTALLTCYDTCASWHTEEC
jgi:hypothetical protein